MYIRRQIHTQKIFVICMLCKIYFPFCDLLFTLLKVVFRRFLMLIYQYFLLLVLFVLFKKNLFPFQDHEAIFLYYLLEVLSFYILHLNSSSIWNICNVKKVSSFLTFRYPVDEPHLWENYHFLHCTKLVLLPQISVLCMFVFLDVIFYFLGMFIYCLSISVVLIAVAL